MTRTFHVDHAHVDWALTLCCSQEEMVNSHCGADLVNANLGVIAHNDANSVIAFHPSQLHGTSQCDHVRSSGVIFTFSKSILKAFQETSKQGVFEKEPPAFTWVRLDVQEDGDEEEDDDDFPYFEYSIPMIHGNVLPN